MRERHVHLPQIYVPNTANASQWIFPSSPQTMMSSLSIMRFFSGKSIGENG
jgi:hypothetical protein